MKLLKKIYKDLYVNYIHANTSEYSPMIEPLYWNSSADVCHIRLQMAATRREEDQNMLILRLTVFMQSSKCLC